MHHTARHHWRRVATCLIATAAVAGRAQLPDIVVAPDGSDDGPGTAARPFATVQRAQAAVRKRVARGLDRDLTVGLRGGVYVLGEPLVFGLEDGGTQTSRVLYTAWPGERAVISGGRRLTGWAEAADGTWTTRVPEVVESQWVFRQLFVNGRRATRARHPNQGWLRVVKSGPDRRTSFSFAANDVPSLDHTAATELVFLHDWSMSRLLVGSVDLASHTLSVSQPIGSPHRAMAINGFEPHPRYALEGNPAFLDAPGEWQLDSASGMLRYRPLPGESPETATVVAPFSPGLVMVRGGATPDRFVRNLHFRNLVFEHSAFTMASSQRYAGVQAGFHEADPGGPRRPIPAAIVVERARECSLVGCCVQHVGGSGVWFGEQCSSGTIADCAVRDISGNGIMVGEDCWRRQINGISWHEAAPEQAAEGNAVTGCLVEDTGRQFFGSIGIWVGLTADTLIARNVVRRTPYTGISVGWMWNTTPTPCRGNHIEFNDIHDVMQLLSDGGGIYTLGRQPDSVIRGNCIHGIPPNAGRAESNGMFLDQGTTGYTIEENTIWDVARSPLRFHQASRNLVRNNVFVVGAGVPEIRYNRTKPEDIEKVGNHVHRQRKARRGEGLYGHCAVFSGAQSVEETHRPELEPAKFTLSAWVRLDEPPPGLPGRPQERRSWVVGKNANEWADGHYALVVTRDLSALAYLNIGGGPDNCHSVESGAGTVPLSKWCFLAATYDGTTLRLYVNGNPAGAVAVGKPRSTGTGPFCVGKRPDNFTWWHGDVDTVILRPAALDAAQLQAAMAADRRGTKPEHAALLLDFDEALEGTKDLGDALTRARAAAGPGADALTRLEALK